MTMMTKAVFTIDGVPYAYIGYTDGTTWNGWECPYFEESEALKIMSDHNNICGNENDRITYDLIEDTFTLSTKESEILDWWKGITYVTEDGNKHLYGIGAYFWIWDKESVPSTARQIKQLIEFADDSKEVDIKELKTKLQDLELCRKAIMILRSNKMAEAQIKELEAIVC